MKKLYVGNLPFQMTEAELRALFEPFGTVERVKVILDYETKRSKGYGFVTMAADGAVKAQAEIKEIGGRTIKIMDAVK